LISVQPPFHQSFIRVVRPDEVDLNTGDKGGGSAAVEGVVNNNEQRSAPA
jgi:hypothetical protein